MTKHDRRIAARESILMQIDALGATFSPAQLTSFHAEPASQDDTIYGELTFVRRLRAMARNAGKMADRIAARNPDAIFTLAGRAGYVASRYRADWGMSYLAADDDPHVVFWESLERELEHRGRSIGQ